MKFLKTCSWITDSDEECGEQCEGNTPFCGTHNRALRKEKENEKKNAEKRASQIAKAKQKSMVPRKKPNKVSKKRAEINKEYFKLVEQFKKDNPHCKAQVNGYCTKYTQDIHHKFGRISDNLTDASGFLPVCRNCHIYIEAHPKEAKERGWSSSRLAKIKETI